MPSQTTPTDTTTRIAIVYHSGFGHTRVIAERVRAGAASVSGVDVDLIPVGELPPPDDDRKSLGPEWERVDGADAIIMGCPTYMGTVSAEFKQFMDSSSIRWFGLEWKNKIAGGFTNSGSKSGDKVNTLTSLAIFAAQHGMVWVGLGMTAGNTTSDGSTDDLNRLGGFLGPMAQSDNDLGPDETPPESDRETAERYGQRIAEATKRWYGHVEPTDAGDASVSPPSPAAMATDS
ncbi:MAG: flavodoxin family protein [Planctomycetota bacterium]